MAEIEQENPIAHLNLLMEQLRMAEKRFTISQNICKIRSTDVDGQKPTEEQIELLNTSLTLSKMYADEVTNLHQKVTAEIARIKEEIASEKEKVDTTEKVMDKVEIESESPELLEPEPEPAPKHMLESDSSGDSIEKEPKTVPPAGEVFVPVESGFDFGPFSSSGLIKMKASVRKPNKNKKKKKRPSRLEIDSNVFEVADGQDFRPALAKARQKSVSALRAKLREKQRLYSEEKVKGEKKIPKMVIIEDPKESQASKNDAAEKRSVLEDALPFATDFERFMAMMRGEQENARKKKPKKSRKSKDLDSSDYDSEDSYDSEMEERVRCRREEEIPVKVHCDDCDKDVIGSIQCPDCHKVWKTGGGEFEFREIRRAPARVNGCDCEHCMMLRLTLTFGDDEQNVWGPEDGVFKEIIGEKNPFLAEGEKSVDQRFTDRVASEIFQNTEVKKNPLPVHLVARLKDRLKETNKPLDCSICLGKIEQGSKLIRLHCMHRFHSDCLRSWFKQQRVCPNCRKEPFPETKKEKTVNSPRKFVPPGAVKPRMHERKLRGVVVSN